jgi:hypothetical protein
LGRRDFGYCREALEVTAFLIATRRHTVAIAGGNRAVSSRGGRGSAGVVVLLSAVVIDIVDPVNWSERRRTARRPQPAAQTASWLALRAFPAIPAPGELMRRLKASCPSIFSTEIGNERTRVPVA